MIYSFSWTLMKDEGEGTIHEISRNHTNEFGAYFVYVRGSVVCLAFSASANRLRKAKFFFL